MIKRLLIANRGEIAVRIIRTAKQLGITTIAVYSDFDRHALHVQLADEACFLGDNEPGSSYLNIAKIIAVAKSINADSIHPGYGFLSENAEFARCCQKKGITFIGPMPESIDLMGSKSAAKKCLEEFNVPLVPGYHGLDQTDKTLLNAAEKVGFPLLIKASAGGGGKGMRIVRHADEFAQGIASAKREAQNAFGNDQLLLERYIEEPRHVEVQVFCDQHGNGVYLFDRDCSIQRRHQKVVEEAPAPDLSDALREQMGLAAVECAKAINYVGAGTVEFLLGRDGHFYFMEMNTRLQVEHPVSEMITGLDFVALQIQIADGQPLPFSQHDLSTHGHAIEVRLYAEDPYHQFLPSTGRITHLRWPDDSEGLRIDSGIQQNDEVGVYYDPMLAKVICWGANRPQALKRLKKALQQTRIVGINTNLHYLIQILNEPAFANATLSTHFIDQYESTLLAPPQPTQEDWSVAVGILAHTKAVNKQGDSRPADQNRSQDPWSSLSHFRINHQKTYDQTLQFEDQVRHFTVIQHPNGRFCIQQPGAKDAEMHIETVSRHQLAITREGHRHIMSYYLDDSLLRTYFPSGALDFILPSITACTEQEDDHSIHAPMNGKVSKLFVESNQQVKKGDTVAIVEAMKMEHSITAPYDGLVGEIYCQEHELVSAGQQILHIDELLLDMENKEADQ